MRKKHKRVESKTKMNANFDESFERTDLSEIESIENSVESMIECEIDLINGRLENSAETLVEHEKDLNNESFQSNVEKESESLVISNVRSTRKRKNDINWALKLGKKRKLENKVLIADKIKNVGKKTNLKNILEDRPELKTREGVKNQY